MNDREITQALAQSGIEVLETMFFVDAVPADEPPAEAFSVEITFDGDPPGHFLLHIAAPAAASIAANFLGEDPRTLTPPQVADVSCELANMICGAALSRLERAATFRLGPPHCGASLPACPVAVSLATPDGVLSLHLQLESPVCPSPAKSAF